MPFAECHCVGITQYVGGFSDWLPSFTLCIYISTIAFHGWIAHHFFFFFRWGDGLEGLLWAGFRVWWSLASPLYPVQGLSGCGSLLPSGTPHAFAQVWGPSGARAWSPSVPFLISVIQYVLLHYRCKPPRFPWQVMRGRTFPVTSSLTYIWYIEIESENRSELSSDLKTGHFWQSS